MAYRILPLVIHLWVEAISFLSVIDGLLEVCRAAQSWFSVSVSDLRNFKARKGAFYLVMPLYHFIAFQKVTGMPVFMAKSRIWYKKKKMLFEAMPRHFLETNSIFVHIPKAAGMSVVNSLYDCDSSNHLSWRDYYLRDKEFWRKAFTFSFVRCPEARFVSAYDYLLRGGMNKIDIYWRDKYLIRYKNRESFLLEGGVEKAIAGGVDHFKSQVDFLVDRNGVIQCDFVGRFETLDTDFEAVASKVRASSSLPKLNSAKVSGGDLSSLEVKKLRSIYVLDYLYFGY